MNWYYLATNANDLSVVASGAFPTGAIIEAISDGTGGTFSIELPLKSSIPILVGENLMTVVYLPNTELGGMVTGYEKDSKRIIYKGHTWRGMLANAFWGAYTTASSKETATTSYTATPSSILASLMSNNSIYPNQLNTDNSGYSSNITIDLYNAGGASVGDAQSMWQSSYLQKLALVRDKMGKNYKIYLKYIAHLANYPPTKRCPGGCFSIVIDTAKTYSLNIATDSAVETLNPETPRRVRILRPKRSTSDISRAYSYFFDPMGTLSAPVQSASAVGWCSSPTAVYTDTVNKTDALATTYGVRRFKKAVRSALSFDIDANQAKFETMTIGDIVRIPTTSGTFSAKITGIGWSDNGLYYQFGKWTEVD